MHLIFIVITSWTMAIVRVSGPWVNNSLCKCMTKHWLLFHPYNVHWLRCYNIVIEGFFPKISTSSAVQVLRKNGQWKIPMYPFTVSMDMVQVSNVKIIPCFHEEILKMGTSSKILIFRSAVMWLSIFKTIRLLYLMCCRMYKDIWRSRRWDELMPAMNTREILQV